MADKTGIEWTEATWNPVTGCAKVSQGCKHCYAERDWGRLLHLPAYAGRAFTDVATHADRLDQPLRWRRPRRIFVNSMSDLFHADVPEEFIDRVFAVMALANQHTFQVLTKRPDRMLAYLSSGARAEMVGIEAEAIGGLDRHTETLSQRWPFPLPNVWLGVSVENQAAADERIPLLLDTPAAVRWISAEPLLGLVYLAEHGLHGGPGQLDWVVAGGESGPKARPMSIRWARDLRNQCAAAGVPFLFKQWGEWAPARVRPSETSGQFAFGDYEHEPDRFVLTDRYPRAFTSFGACAIVERVGKKAAGRLLDGVQHDGYPETQR